MKKIIAVLLSLTVAFGLVGCGAAANDGPDETQTPQTTSAEEPLPQTDDVNTSAQTDSDAPAADQPEGEQTSDDDRTNVLVAYFSATGTTEGVAENIAAGLNADLYEIVPQEPYTDADLNYNDDDSRSTIEMNDPDARPAIFGSVENMEQYDIVFIGYPIWWGEAPRIISTFVESYDFSGKTIVPFCTSGGSGIGSSAEDLEELTSGAEWLSGSRLRGSDSQEDVMEWVNGLGLNF